jgi:hypothetical protein
VFVSSPRVGNYLEIKLIFTVRAGKKKFTQTQFFFPTRTVIMPNTPSMSRSFPIPKIQTVQNKHKIVKNLCFFLGNCTLLLGCGFGQQKVTYIRKMCNLIRRMYSTIEMNSIAVSCRHHNYNSKCESACCVFKYQFRPQKAKI